MPVKPRILAIDDTPANLFTLGSALVSEFELQIANSGEMGLSLAQKSPPDLILLDIMMPGMDGFETCRQLKADPRLKDIPVIFVTALHEIESEIKGLELGAQDYITKPIQVETARQRIRNLLEREGFRKQMVLQRDRLEAEIGEHEKTQAVLRRLTVAIEQSPASVVITDIDARIQYVNPRFTAVTGYSPEEVIGQNPRILQSGQTSSQLYPEMWAKVMAGQVWQGELINKRKNGELYWEECQIAPVRDANGLTTNYVAVKSDITERKKTSDEIKLLAFYDPLTKLANRRLMTDRMEQTLALTLRSGELVAICVIDLDGFKQVNDRMGHQAGDLVLVEAARRLQECIRPSDTASRIGGDEFALILGGFKDISQCEKLLRRISLALAEPYAVVGDVAHVTASIGVTVFPNDGSSANQLLRHADQAMYEAKEGGKNCFRLFNPTHQNQQRAGQATLKKIAKALEAGQLVLFYQPQVDCRLGKVTGVEALIRWQHPILGLLGPAEFIPLLEQDDLIIAVGEWVIQQALRQLMQWRSEGIDLTISVNVAARQLHHANFTTRLQELLADYEADVIGRLGIEILETAALEDINAVTEAVRQCRALGIHVALDDFGTGFSSLAHLKRLPVDVLKIDQSFVFGMLRDPEDLAIVSAVIGLAASFGRKVIAEGVESNDHALLLIKMGCHLMQGYGIARPMPADQLARWLQSFEPNPLWALARSKLPSRGYFEVLLAQANHHHWVNQFLASFEGSPQAADPDVIANHHLCRFGQWYYDEGMRHFSSNHWFRSIEPLHQRVHQLAVRLRVHQCNGDSVGAQIDKVELLAQQDELDQMLSNLRDVIADNYATSDLLQLTGDAA